MHRGQGIGYRLPNTDARMTTTFPGYRSPKDWRTEYPVQTEASLDTLRNQLYSLSVQARQIATDAQRVQELALANQGALGRNQALRVGNSINLETINTLQTMLQTMQSLSNAYAVVETRKINQEAQAQAVQNAWMKNGNKPVPTSYGAGGWKDTLPDFQ